MKSITIEMRSTGATGQRGGTRPDDRAHLDHQQPVSSTRLLFRNITSRQFCCPALVLFKDKHSQLIYYYYYYYLNKIRHIHRLLFIHTF